MCNGICEVSDMSVGGHRTDLLKPPIVGTVRSRVRTAANFLRTDAHVGPRRKPETDSGPAGAGPAPLRTAAIFSPGPAGSARTRARRIRPALFHRLRDEAAVFFGPGAAQEAVVVDTVQDGLPRTRLRTQRPDRQQDCVQARPGAGVPDPGLDRGSARGTAAPGTLRGGLAGWRRPLQGDERAAAGHHSEDQHDGGPVQEDGEHRHVPERGQAVGRARNRRLPDGRPLGEEEHPPGLPVHPRPGPRLLPAPGVRRSVPGAQAGRGQQARVHRAPAQGRGRNHQPAVRHQQRRQRQWHQLRQHQAHVNLSLRSGRPGSPPDSSQMPPQSSPTNLCCRQRSTTAGIVKELLPRLGIRELAGGVAAILMLPCTRKCATLMYRNHARSHPHRCGTIKNEAFSTREVMSSN